jgi:hypothetical protein
MPMPKIDLFAAVQGVALFVSSAVAGQRIAHAG